MPNGSRRYRSTSSLFQCFGAAGKCADIRFSHGGDSGWRQRMSFCFMFRSIFHSVRCVRAPLSRSLISSQVHPFHNYRNEINRLKYPAKVGQNSTNKKWKKMSRTIIHLRYFKSKYYIPQTKNPREFHTPLYRLIDFTLNHKYMHEINGSDSVCHAISI